ncbi:MAG: hypothetical protein QFB87_04680 [Patescibacteria group bacterium]|nr:hypothetical protein [Patescibacteria group bacterium]
MSKQETITLNGKTYVEVDPNKKDVQPAVETDHIIVIAQRGWIFEGYKNKAVKDKLQLLNANVVRSWSNGKGIGGLAESKIGYTLDPVGSVSFANEAIIATINVRW